MVDEELNEELDEGQRLALELVDHVDRMEAHARDISVSDRAEEYVVRVIAKAQHEEEQRKLGNAQPL